MRKHAASLRPKFEMILDTFDKGLKDLGVGSWAQPGRVGYFITCDAGGMRAKSVVELGEKGRRCDDTGRSTVPVRQGPEGSVIRISPSYPSLEDLTTATQIFVVCVKLASIEKILRDSRRKSVNDMIKK